MDSVTRRKVVTLTAAGAAAMVAGTVHAQNAVKAAGHYFSGTSTKGQLQDALDDAIKKALASAPGADRQVKWTLKNVTGINGGLKPMNTITVEIEATVT